MWIKICGITRPEDAIVVRQAGADAIGLNFFEGSKRYVTPEVARGIVLQLRSSLEQPDVDSQTGSPPKVNGLSLRNLPDTTRSATIAADHDAGVDLVGVFVNATPEMMAEIVEQAGLTAVQFHGDESVEQILRFRRLQPDTSVIRAVRVNQQNLSDVAGRLRELTQEADIAAVLVDAMVAGQFGGTGHAVDHRVFGVLRDQLPDTRMILAGGLNPQNVGQAIQATEPWGVDTASGVESYPGIKDRQQVLEFVQSARRSRLGSQSDRR